MSNDVKKPLDREKVLVWLQNESSRYLDGLEYARDRNRFSEALAIQAKHQLCNSIQRYVNEGTFDLDEAPPAKDGLQTLAEIWDKWNEPLEDKNHVNHIMDGAILVEHIGRKDLNGSYKHSLAVKLALAVHMEIDGAVGYHENGPNLNRYDIGLLDTGQQQLRPFTPINLSPYYMRYGSREGCERACELLQCVANALFMVPKEVE